MDKKRVVITGLGVVSPHWVAVQAVQTEEI